ncbi:Topoisomerase 1 [Spraguea lophii 42_110]|uniref:polynucleotide adenylyltransferase n=1 Tax=Spraguea lophii (strain 42_110) TaxID=1358809 RepID=S7XPC7_SPRLO|nr:Topoisomerase 1 [Spraguea lophii 42_110]
MEEDFIGFKRLIKQRKYQCFNPSSFLKTGNGYKNKSNIERLNEELLDFYENLLSSDEEYNIRQMIMNEIKDILEDENYKISSFGSFSYNLFLPTSDIDIIIEGEEEEIEKNTKKEDNDLSNRRKKLENNEILKNIFNVMKDRLENIIHLSKARIPILRCIESKFGFRIDISVNHNGLKHSEYILKAINKYPIIKPFCMLLKNFLYIRGLTDSKRGGLCAYGQFLMILNFLELHPVIQSTEMDPFKNLGVLFMDFFQYYGFDFFYDNSMITLNHYKKNKSKNMLSIEDPTSGKDVGTNCFNMFVIKEVFQHAYKVMNSILSSKIDKHLKILSCWMEIDENIEVWREIVKNKYYEVIKKEDVKILS